MPRSVSMNNICIRTKMSTHLALIEPLDIPKINNRLAGISNMSLRNPTWPGSSHFRFQPSHYNNIYSLFASHDYNSKHNLYTFINYHIVKKNFYFFTFKFDGGWTFCLNKGIVSQNMTCSLNFKFIYLISFHESCRQLGIFLYGKHSFYFLR